MVLPKKMGLKGAEENSSCPEETSPCWEMRGTHMPSAQGLELTGMAQAAPAGVNREQCQGVYNLPTAFMQVVRKGFLVSFH